mgnify:CR=1 FL=1
MFLRNMADQTFDKFHGRNSFKDEFIILVTIVVKSDQAIFIFINTGSSNDRTTEITADIFNNSIRVTFVRLGIYIEAMFMIAVTVGFNLFERRI